MFHFTGAHAMKTYQTAILVVEDDANDQELIKVAFGGLGLTIAYLMGDGKYSEPTEYPYPSFIITDLKMPRASGFEVLEHLKANPAFAIIPTVVLTASTDPDDIKKSYALGASSYHVKPHTLAELSSLIKVLHDYWMICEVPEVNAAGKQLPTDPKGQLGEKFP